MQDSQSICTCISLATSAILFSKTLIYIYIYFYTHTWNIFSLSVFIFITIPDIMPSDIYTSHIATTKRRYGSRTTTVVYHGTTKGSNSSSSTKNITNGQGRLSPPPASLTCKSLFCTAGFVFKVSSTLITTSSDTRSDEYTASRHCAKPTKIHRQVRLQRVSFFFCCCI